MTDRPTLADAEAALRRHFGYPAFRPGQTRAITSVLAGRDTVVVLPTGGGKSLCYQVPALLQPHLTVVISPLISLMKDQVDALVARGLPATFVNSSLSSSEIADRLAQARAGKVKLLYLAPERFDAGNTAERLRDAGVSLLAVDEAHCISEWGHDFRPSYLRIASVRERLGNPPTVALTATATPRVRDDIARVLGLTSAETIITGFDRTNLAYHVVSASTEAAKDQALVAILSARPGLAVVYASTRRAVERIEGVLRDARIPSAAYHAGLDDAHRQQVQNDFMQERVRAIVATNAFGMGIDKPNVRTVVHHAMPGSLEAYYQEAGRAGRDGLPGECFLLHAFQDRFTHEFFIKGAYPERRTVEAVYAALHARANPDGTLDVDPAAIASSIRGETNPKEVEAALRVLSSAGAFIARRAGGSRATVRLLATPARIRAELSGESDALAVGLLRSLWRIAGDRLQTGTIVDLDRIPPGFGGAIGARRLLDALQARQFVHWTPADPAAAVPMPRRPLAAYRVDWEAITRRRQADLGKLEAMQRYAYLKSCRRGFVLRYFGDPDARQRCTGCDNCLGIRATVKAPVASARRARVPEKGSARASRGAPTSAPLDPAQETLLARLRTLRSTIAREAKVPAYVVFPDRTLDAMARERPRNEAQLLQISGVGPLRAERYGQRFLSVLNAP